MFGLDFYPTPKNVIAQMVNPSDVRGKIVLEPSAGKGDIIDYLNFSGAYEVLACETDPNLRAILQGKCNLICDDFLKTTKEMVSHIDLIVMNPPFSKSTTHIRHAWEVAPEGCQIISLCNYESYASSYSNKEIVTLISDYGSIISLGDCFSSAERKTDVNIGMITLHKPALSSSFDYDGFYLNEEDIDMNSDAGLMQRNEIKLLVEHYVRALRCFDDIYQSGENIRSFMTALGCHKPEVGVSFSYNENTTTKEAFAKKLQKNAWQKVFDLTNVNKFITSNVYEDINRFMNAQSNVPFTVKNIYRMLDLLIASRNNIMNTAIERAIDAYTKLYKENRYGVEGWATNSGYMLNRKFIANHGAEMGINGYMWISIWSNPTENIENLEKAVCYVRGYDWDFLHEDREEWEKRCREAGRTLEPKRMGLKRFFSDNKIEPGVWYKWGLFRLKAFKKGTIHFEFLNEDDWAYLNMAYAKIKGQVLPEKMTTFKGKKRT